MNQRADNGGVPAGIAMVRWAGRLYRREWRQQALVLGLLTAAVAGALLFATATYNTAGVPDNATFGSGNHRFIVDDVDQRSLDAGIAAAAERFGAVDVIAQWTAPVPGSVSSVTYRAQDPSGPFSAPMLDVGDGRAPVESAEVAVTDGVADELDVTIGDVLTLDGTPRRIVGVVENPSDLNDEFALAAVDDRRRASSTTILIGGGGGFDEVAAIRDFGGEHLPDADLTTRGDVRRTAEAAVVTTVALVAIVLVSLVASAGFVAVAQRRLRQLGMLGAVGATERHLRLVVVVNGAIVGVTAAVAGAVLGAGAWLILAPRMEAAVGFRIDSWRVPWPLVAVTLVAVLVATITAAWWPARIVSRVSVTDALAGRPPAVRPIERSAGFGVAMAASGAVVLAVAGRSSALVLGVGTIAVVVGVLALSPTAIRSCAVIARPMPVAVRIALRDLSRYRTRSATALAAVSLALGIPVAIVVVASAADEARALGNTAPDQLLIWTRDPSQPEGMSPFFTEDPDDEGFAPYLPDLTAADLDRMATAIAQVAEREGVRIVDLDVAVDPAAQDDPAGRRAVTIARPTEIGYLDVALLYVATPELLAARGIRADELDGDAILTAAPDGPADVVTDTGQLWLANTSAPPSPLTDVMSIDRTYTSLPSSVVLPRTLLSRGWDSVPVGWLLQSDAPFTDEQVAAIRTVAAAEGMLVERRVEHTSLAALRWAATGVGTLLALTVLAMTVGLIRAEAARDIRVLTAAGATSTIRRAVTACTAGGLATAGGLLGCLGAYVALVAGYVGDRSSLTPIPIAHLAAIIAGVPITATLAAWLVAGREPTDIARSPLDPSTETITPHTQISRRRTNSPWNKGPTGTAWGRQGANQYRPVLKTGSMWSCTISFG